MSCELLFIEITSGAQIVNRICDRHTKAGIFKPHINMIERMPVYPCHFHRVSEFHFGVLENDLSAQTIVWLERYGSVAIYETQEELQINTIFFLRYHVHRIKSTSHKHGNN